MKKTYLILLIIIISAVIVFINYSRNDQNSIPAVQPSDSEKTQVKNGDINKAIEQIRAGYPKLAGATDNISENMITSVEEVLDGWIIKIHWGWCPECYCVFHVFENYDIVKLDECECNYNKGE